MSKVTKIRGLMILLLIMSLALGSESSSASVASLLDTFSHASFLLKGTRVDLGQTWTTLAMPTTLPDRLSAAVVYNPVNDRIYMYGGSADGTLAGIVNLCQEYNPLTNTWTDKAPMANRRNWIKGFWTKNNRMYAIGGTNQAGTRLRANEEYDPETNTWTTRDSLPGARSAYLGGVWRDSLIYVLGGVDAAGAGRTEVYIYNPWTNTWTTGTPLPLPADMGDAVIVGDTIFITNAYKRPPPAAAWPNLVKGWINPASPTSITWITGPAFPAATYAAGATALGRDVYWLGGLIDGAATNRWFKYDGTTGTISEMFPSYPITLARNCYMTSRPLENALYVIAGDSGGNWDPPNRRYMKRVLPFPNDVGCTKIVAPTGTIDSGTVIYPACSVYNYGSETVTYPVRMKIGEFYDQTATVSGHTPLTYRHITFPTWAANQRGTHTVTCTTELTGDMNTGNDKRTGSVTVRVRDVGTIAITAPTGTIDSTPSVVPACTIQNFGTTTVGPYLVRMKIGTFYNQTATVSSHSPGTKLYLTFPAYANWPRGTHPVTCSTELAGDMQPGNDKATGTVAVRVLDARTVSILAPTGTVNQGAVVIPRAVIRNNGNTTQTIKARFKIFDGSGYDATATAENLAPGAEVTLSFASWTAISLGSWTTQCSTELPGDMVPANDKGTGPVFVQRLDAECISIDAPTGTVDSGTFIQPKATVRNNGNTHQTFDVTFSIEGGYENMKTVTLGPGAQQQVTFDAWTAGPAGTLATKCTTKLAGDMDNTNDKEEGTVFVQNFDARTVSILAPTGTVNQGAVVIPQAVIRNNGNTTQTIKARFKIFDGSGYDATATATLAPGETTTLSFAAWTADTPGSWTTQCSTELDGDMMPANDKATCSVFVQRLDAQCVSIVAPTGAVPQGATVTPQAIIRNSGNTTQTIRARFKINDGSGYDATATATLAPGAEVTLSFAAWTANTPGSWTTQCSTELTGDMNTANDKQTGTVTVITPGWVRLPVTVPGRPVGDGGGLVTGTGRIFIMKGNNTRDFYEFLPDTLVRWIDSVRASPRRRVRKGAAMAYDGTKYLYYTIGNNTSEFWRYNTNPAPGETIWKSLAPVPGARLRGGTGMAFAGGNIYLLKGSGTREFWRYHIALNTWDSLRSAPAVADVPRGYGDGSCLIYDGAFIYALRNRFTEFYRYDIATNSWTARCTMPHIHPWVRRRNRVGAGAAMTLMDGKIYAFKGGNTKEFWMYDPTTDRWIPKETIPRGPERKYVRDGGGLATFDGTIYALKGNKTEVIYRYVPPSLIFSLLPNTGAQGYVVERKSVSLTISPNPTRGITNVYYSLPEKEMATLRIYNLLGELVYSAKGNKGVFTIQRLPAGIYFLRFEAKGYREERKLVVVK